MQQPNDWYKGFRRWEPTSTGSDVASMAIRPLLAEMIGAGIVAADSGEARWEPQTHFDVEGDGVLGMSNTPGPMVRASWGFRLRLRAARTIRARSTRSCWS